jgi:beta-lactamase class A
VGLLSAAAVVHAPRIRGSASEADVNAQIAAIERRLGGRLGVAALDTGSGRQLAHRASERFPLCSTFKFLAAAAVLARVDRGEDRLDRFVRYGAGDLLDYAPIAKQHVQDGGMTLAAVLEAAITYSDNTAANLALAAIGGPQGLTTYVRQLGDPTTRLDRNEPSLNLVPPGDIRDTTSPAAMLGDMKALLVGDRALSASSRAQLIAWLVGNTTGAERLRAGFPGGWRIGDKTGTGPNGATNDVAIAWPPGRAAILVSAYFYESSAPDDDRNRALADVARIVTGEFAATRP